MAKIRTYPIIWRETDGRLFSGVIAGAATNPPQLLTPERMLTIDILPPELRGLTFPQIAGLYDRYLPIEVDLKKLDLKI